VPKTRIDPFAQRAANKLTSGRGQKKNTKSRARHPKKNKNLTALRTKARNSAL
jgi:hypothetical protein